ncbi:hypothetical protein M9458_002897, partial [Cirrhinus mrigala]
DALLRPDYLFLLLEQGEKSLEGHTRLFVFLANLTSYPDDALCAFYDASLDITSSELRHFRGVDTGKKWISIPR